MVPVEEKNPGSGAFSAFAESVYARDTVRETCLEWQDRYGADVNLLLFACWFGLTRGEMPDGLMQQAVQLSSAWQEKITGPLRQCRRDMKHWHPGGVRTPRSPDYEALRAQIKAAELDAERQQEADLKALCDRHGSWRAPGPGQSGALVRANLALYCLEAGIIADPAELSPLVDQALKTA
ncbi:MAG: TIGR02444 family protein [Pseudohongiellaceae bacterium]